MDERDSWHIGRIDSRAIVHLKSWMPARTPPPLGTVTIPTECRLLELGPGEWLLISDTLAPETLREQAWQFRTLGIAAAGPSPGLAALLLEGPGAPEVLGQGCGLDLHSSRLASGSCTRTRLAQLPVIIEVVDSKPRFELYVGRSYRDYLCSWLCDAARGFI